MSDSEDDSCVPDANTAQSRVKEFESVTNTDEILAQMYLQENKWDLSRALNSYFATKCEFSILGVLSKLILRSISINHPTKNITCYIPHSSHHGILLRIHKAK